jgi:hypothetical protein
MPYAIVAGTDPVWVLDPLELEKQVASFAKANGITNQSDWLTFITGLTVTQADQVSRVLLRSVICRSP